MADEHLRQIAAAINMLIAQNNAQKVVLQAILGQMSGTAEDWRDRLDYLRSIALRSIEEMHFPGQESEPIREAASAYVEELFDEVHEGISRWEAGTPPAL